MCERTSLPGTVTGLAVMGEAQQTDGRCLSGLAWMEKPVRNVLAAYVTQSVVGLLLLLLFLQFAPWTAVISRQVAGPGRGLNFFDFFTLYFWSLEIQK